MGLKDKIKHIAMRLREKIKLAHEKTLADELLESLDIKRTKAAHGNPNKNEPDRIYRIDEEIVGIEVVTGYYTEADAQVAHETAENPPAENEAVVGEIMGDLDNAICQSIQNALNGKCEKTYSGTDETWLCINVEGGITEITSIQECVENLEVPQDHPFARIFVTARKSEIEGGGLAVIEVPL